MDDNSLNNEPLEQEGQEGKDKTEEYLAGWRRAQADYQNLKRETEREKQDFTKYANERLLQELLPALDQFSLAMKFLPDTKPLPDDQRKTWENWLIGIRAVQGLWDQAATSVGLERIKTDGKFDPMVHDAVGEEVADDKESGSILKVLQDGWKLHGKVLRHAKVVIVK
jgi:molecular chaperone GrpE